MSRKRNEIWVQNIAHSHEKRRKPNPVILKKFTRIMYKGLPSFADKYFKN